jgi:hypothetical protein
MLERAGMDPKEANIIWTAFEEVAPNLCYIQRTRDLLEALMEEAVSVEQLSNMLEDELAEFDNPSFRTDIRILGGRLRKSIKA